MNRLLHLYRAHNRLTLCVCALMTVLSVAGCSSVRVEGFPDVDLGAKVEVYKSTGERNLHLHIFDHDSPLESDDRLAVLFFHGGGLRTTRVPQFEPQARSLGANGMVGIIVEYRVRPEGVGRNEIVSDASDAVRYVRANATRLGIDPRLVVIAGSSAGGALAVEASADSAGIVLFNPAVEADSTAAGEALPIIVFHSREDRIVPIESARRFCSQHPECRMSEYPTGDHGYFNSEPALSETTAEMLSFLRSLEAG